MRGEFSRAPESQYSAILDRTGGIGTVNLLGEMSRFAVLSITFEQAYGERSGAVGTDHQRLLDIGGFRRAGDKYPDLRVGQEGPRAERLLSGSARRTYCDAFVRRVHVIDDRICGNDQHEMLAQEIQNSQRHVAIGRPDRGV